MAVELGDNWADVPCYRGDHRTRVLQWLAPGLPLLPSSDKHGRGHDVRTWRPKEHIGVCLGLSSPIEWRKGPLRWLRRFRTVQFMVTRTTDLDEWTSGWRRLSSWCAQVIFEKGMGEWEMQRTRKDDRCPWVKTFSYNRLYAGVRSFQRRRPAASETCWYGWWREYWWRKKKERGETAERIRRKIRPGRRDG